MKRLIILSLCCLFAGCSTYNITVQPSPGGPVSVSVNGSKEVSTLPVNLPINAEGNTFPMSAIP